MAESPAVLLWWALLSAVSVGNIVAWTWVSRGAPANRRRQRALSLVFVLVCAFRSFLPRADVQRICLVDSWWSTVLVGRAVATIAELSFVAQWALLLGETARDSNAAFAGLVARAMVPMIAFAEVCSWYAVVTTSYLGNTLEESTWTLTAVLAIAAAASLAPRLARRYRPFVGVVFALGLAYVAFMCTVDVPMYFTRWRADTAAARPYLGLADGFHDLATRWVVTRSWEDWHEELAWMAGYFSVAVWASIALVRAPRLISEARPEARS
jgi:hypothetical protein